jgi:hypothetical protein
VRSWAWTGRVLAGIVATPVLAAVVACSGSEVPLGPLPGDTAAPPDSVVYLPGVSYWGTAGFIEYIAGDLPLILSASHGGDLEPAGIPNRTAGRCGGAATTVTDRNTRELTLAMRDALRDRFEGYPHVVINHLHRVKLDANREVGEAACGDAAAIRAWNEFHHFLEIARVAVIERHGRGWFMDIHGHGHAIQRLELGYLLGRTDLNRSDAELAENDAYRRASSIQTMAGFADRSFPDLLRGELSLGTLYADQGFPTVPSLADPAPGQDPYFTGGYNTVRYGCGDGADRHGGDPAGPLCGVQVEANFRGVRDTRENRERFAVATALIVGLYLALHWDLEVAPAR